MREEPIREPTKTGNNTEEDLRIPETPNLRKEITAAALAARTPTLFEPLACVPGTPAKTKSGTVMVEPPPAMVLITPAAKPPKTNSSASAMLNVCSAIFQAQ